MKKQILIASTISILFSITSQAQEFEAAGTVSHINVATNQITLNKLQDYVLPNNVQSKGTNAIYDLQTGDIVSIFGSADAAGKRIIQDIRIYDMSPAEREANLENLETP